MTSVAIYAMPPWQAGATALAQFQPSDGAFNSTTENITVDLPASSLSAGRQLLYLRATDALGNAGPVAAVFVTVGQSDPLFQNGFE